MQDIILDSKVNAHTFVNAAVSNGLLQWSGSAIPQLSDDVQPKFTPCKWQAAKVIGYCQDAGYLGVILKVREYSQEYKDANPSLITRMFGAEIKPY